jgi:hypothetical protein
VDVVVDVADAAALDAVDSIAVDSVAVDLGVQDLELDLDAQDLDLDAQVVSALVVSELVSDLYKKNLPLLILRRGIPIFSICVNFRYSTNLISTLLRADFPIAVYFDIKLNYCKLFLYTYGSFGFGIVL